MGRSNLGAKALCDGSETTLHVHPGGGNGPVIKTGEIVTDGLGEGVVVFGTPFPDANYAISFGCLRGADTPIATFLNKAAGGFDVKTENDIGKAEPNVVVNWIATPYSNL